MRLIVGGAAQGKLKYILVSTGLTEETVGHCATGDIVKIFEKKIVYQLHELVGRLMKKQIEPLSFIEKNLCANHIVICNEVGGGIVPIDKFERAYRDAVGEVCCQIAAQADIVERVCCGIPKRLKG